jgi:hypothetical protein
MDPPNRLHCTKAKNIWNAQLTAKVQANQRCQPGFLTPPSWHMIGGILDLVPKDSSSLVSQTKIRISAQSVTTKWHPNVWVLLRLRLPAAKTCLQLGMTMQRCSDPRHIAEAKKHDALCVLFKAKEPQTCVKCKGKY